MSSQPALAVRSGRHPHEIALLVMSVVIGVLGLVFPGGVSPAPQGTLPGRILYAFFIGLIIAGATSLFGALRDSLSGLLWERFGLSMLTCLYLAYAVAVLTYTGSRGLTTALFVGSMAVASLVRVVQIVRDIKTVKEMILNPPVVASEMPEEGR